MFSLGGGLGLPQFIGFFVADESFDKFARLVVRELPRRRFHEITRGSIQCAADAAIKRELGAANGIYYNAG
jgi:hypothetical protein